MIGASSRDTFDNLCQFVNFKIKIFKEEIGVYRQVSGQF